MKRILIMQRALVINLWSKVNNMQVFYDQE